MNSTYEMFNLTISYLRDCTDEFSVVHKIT